MQATQARLKKELNELKKLSPDMMIGADIYNDNITHWKGYVKGPSDTPYAGGHFVIDIKLPNDYPFSPPKMQFDTKIWHPNMSSVTGAICLDTLKSEWSPALTIRTSLLSILALLSAANPDDPQDGVVAKQFKEDRKSFDQKAREWTKKYAVVGQEAPFEFPTELEMLTNMGFDPAECKRTLTLTAGNVDKAVDLLMK